MFESKNQDSDNLLVNIEDWHFEERLSKEFESVGFFISDHPLNQFKEIFEDYKIINFNDFKISNDKKESNIAATLLKIQEKKTQKGNSYAIIKLTDLTSVFELFIFSELLEQNRKLLVEGNSLLITLIKNVSEDNNRFKRINIKKIISLKNLFTKEIENVEFNVNGINKIEDLSNFLLNNGDTNVTIKVKDKENIFSFKLKNKRKVDQKSLNLIRNKDISTNIS